MIIDYILINPRAGFNIEYRGTYDVEITKALRWLGESRVKRYPYNVLLGIL